MHVVDQSQNGRVISPGYTDDPACSIREEQPSAHVIGDSIQVSILLLMHFAIMIGLLLLDEVNFLTGGIFYQDSI